MSSEQTALLALKDVGGLVGHWGARLGNELQGRYASWQARRRLRIGLRGLLLYFLPMPLAVASLLALFQGDAFRAVATALALAIMMAAARLNRHAMMQSLLQGQRQFSRQSTFAWQPLAMLLIGLGVGISANITVGYDLVVSSLFAALSMGGFHLAYLSGNKDKHVVSKPSAFVHDSHLQQTLANSEELLISIERDALSIRNPEMSQRLERIADLGRQIINYLAEHPAKLSRGRRFLHVYLEGAHRVAAGYASSHRIQRIGVLENKFRQVLVAIEKAFDKTMHDFQQDVVEDLDVQIEVLKQQLRQEGFI